MKSLRGRLHSLFSSETLPEDIENWQPADKDSFGIGVQVFVAAENEQGVDSFDVLVCTPRWLVENWNHPQVGLHGLGEGVKSGRGLLFMTHWDYPVLESAIRKLIEGTNGPTWGDLANRIGRHLPWEFDYKYDEAQDSGQEIP